jgi:hypothetical protein
MTFMGENRKHLSWPICLLATSPAIDIMLILIWSVFTTRRPRSGLLY